MTHRVVAVEEDRPHIVDDSLIGTLLNHLRSDLPDEVVIVHKLSQ